MAETEVVRYRRSKSGKTVHLADCSVLGGRGHPWPFADDIPVNEIWILTVTYPWLILCARCLGEKPRE